MSITVKHRAHGLTVNITPPTAEKTGYMVHIHCYGVVYVYAQFPDLTAVNAVLAEARQKLFESCYATDASWAFIDTLRAQIAPLKAAEVPIKPAPAQPPTQPTPPPTPA